MASKKSDDRKTLVIVGAGGFGGVLAHELSVKFHADKLNYNLVVINPRPYYLHNVASPRSVVSAMDNLEERALIPFDNLFVDGNGTFIQNKVTSIEEKGKGLGGHVKLDNGETVAYDALVLSPGSTWPGPVGFPDDHNALRAQLTEWRARFAAAKEIAVVGGGAVGIELAGEIRDVFPSKKIYLVHAASQLLNDVYPDHFRSFLAKIVTRRNIELVLGDRLEVPPEGTVGVTTQNGRSLPNVDLVVPCFGPKPNTGFISSLGPSVLTERGFVKVNRTLEVQGHPGVFAMGDVCDLPEQKQLGKNGWHTPVVAANLQSFLAGQPLTRLYKTPPELIAIPVGKTDGATYFGYLWGIVLGQWITKMIKGPLFINLYRKKLGLPPESPRL
ncbi:hypothetical protein EIP91_010670 [Steccherinum ochraceum]|uniref:FAD/NAD(P)-binding domain-containing protein n=1 Tax=Steccherinum ochraceum TaxID=92696 RepID=A0A4R0RQL5_9APHY|nr:hypothetical protein EIP91_010670 [Steccherinum ochraceum]